MATSHVPSRENMTRGASFYPKNGIQQNCVETQIVEARRLQAEAQEREDRKSKKRDTR